MNDTTATQRTPAPFDTWAVLDFWSRRWGWVMWWTILLAIAGGYVAHLTWARSFTSTAQLIHYEPSAVDDSFKPRDISAPSLVVMLQSPALFEKVGAQLTPALSATALSRRLQLNLDRNNDVVTVTGNGSDRDATVSLVNQFSDAAIAYTQGLQKQEASDAADYVTHQLAQVEGELKTERAAVPPSSAGVVAALSETSDAPDPVASDLPQRLQSARDQLNDLQVRLTDIHPLVREQQARVAALEEQQRKAAAAAANSPTRVHTSAAATSPAAIYGRITPEEVAMGERLRTLENNRALLISHQRAIQPFHDNPPGYFRVLMPATGARTLEHNHRLEITLCAILGAFLGLMGSAGQILLGEFMDNRVKTRADVRRVTGLPLLAALGDLAKLSPVARDQWAFRAWTALQSRLSLSPNHGMVCGITSANFGDGRSTWVDLLGRAASGCGFRVLTITAQPPPEMIAEIARENKMPPPPTPAAPAGVASAGSTDLAKGNVSLTASVLDTPGQIVARLAAVDAPPMVNIPLPGWVWNLERRKQWLSALEAWRAIENVVIFIELPPAAVAETVLLAENIPNLLWLVDANKTDAGEMQSELATLRDARCNLVGAVLNRERSRPVRGRFSRWVGTNAAIIFLAGLGMVWPGQTADAAGAEMANPAPSAEPAASAAFSVVNPPQRMAWQQKLTLGPGDVLNFHLFGSPELTREEVPIGPDGRVSYLEAENIVAAGLTVDEFRDRLNEALGKFRRAPQAYVTPLVYRSKRYYMLGTVVQKGVFPLDRPMTVIEAVARSRGFETALNGGNMVETTDFSRSFIARGGQHLPVDMEKLFLHGDLSQNVALEPNDYLYFPAGGASSVYVLGEVHQPGAVPYSPRANVLAAIAARGGFTDRAWAQRVLVVRGSMDHPETFKINTAGALAGESPNFELKPGDVVYVYNRPWVRAEELIDRAASAFVEAAVVAWTGIHLGPKGSPSISIP